MKNEIEIIKVIWVDDQIKTDLQNLVIGFSMPQKREGFDKKFQLEITECESWEEAKEKLNSHYHFMILDAHCKLKKDEEDKPNDGKFIFSVIRGEAKNYNIPFFIFSAGIQKAPHLSFYETFEPGPDYQWRVENNKHFYEKNTDDEALLNNIIDAYIHKDEWQISNVLYPQIFEALRELKADPQVGKDLMQLLLPIHYPGMSVASYNHMSHCLRDCMEHLFRMMSTKGMVPYVLVNKDVKSQISINQCFNWLVECGYIPKFLGGLFKSVKSLVSYMHHTTGEKDNFSTYTEALQSTYLLKSLTFWLCDFILWLNNYLQEHPKPKENKEKWPKDVDNEKFENGTLHWDSKTSRWYIQNVKIKDPKIQVKGWLPMDMDEDASYKNNYTEGEECRFLIKNVNNKYYAYCIKGKDLDESV